MSFNDALTLILATFALLISLLTFIYTVAKRASIHMLIGQNIRLKYTWDYKLYVVADFAFFNQGAQPGAIVEILGTIKKDNASENFDFRWTTFEETKNIAPPGKPTKLWTSSTDNVHTIIIPGRTGGTGGIMQQIRLLSYKPCKLGSGLDNKNYTLELRALVGPGLTKWCVVSVNLKISPYQANYLEHSCVEDKSTGIAKDTLRLERKTPSKRNRLPRLFDKPAIPDFISTLEASVPFSSPDQGHA
jgi:hypothetical protein